MHFIALYPMIDAVARLVTPVVNLGAVYGIHSRLRHTESRERNSTIDVRCGTASIHTSIEDD